jgi:hypothetical protein
MRLLLQMLHAAVSSSSSFFSRFFLLLPIIRARFGRPPSAAAATQLPSSVHNCTTHVGRRILQQKTHSIITHQGDHLLMRRLRTQEAAMTSGTTTHDAIGAMLMAFESCAMMTGACKFSNRRIRTSIPRPQAEARHGDDNLLGTSTARKLLHQPTHPALSLSLPTTTHCKMEQLPPSRLLSKLKKHHSRDCRFAASKLHF